MTPSSDTATDVALGNKVGVVGLGLMGSAIAERLLKAGYTVMGCDIQPERVTAAELLGVLTTPDAREIAAQCDRIVLSLYDSADVRSVLDQMGARLRAGHIVLDTTTGDVESAEAAGRRWSAAGVMYLDATISGNRDQLQQGQATIMVGGPRAGFDACHDLLKSLAEKSFHIGDWGAGAKMKLVTNLVLGLNRAALAEGFVLARTLGLAPAQVLAVLLETPAYSRIMDAKGPKMVEGNFEPQARLSQHLKDVHLMIEAATRAGQRLPLSETHRELLELAERLGLSALDNSAILRVIEAQRLPPESQ